MHGISRITLCLPLCYFADTEQCHSQYDVICKTFFAVCCLKKVFSSSSDLVRSVAVYDVYYGRASSLLAYFLWAVWSVSWCCITWVIWWFCRKRKNCNSYVRSASVDKLLMVKNLRKVFSALCLKNVALNFRNNFAKSQPIFKIISAMRGWNLQQNVYNNFHHALHTLLHPVKCSTR